MRVKPATPGSVIRDPHTRVQLPDEGARVPDNSFWQRRLRDGDVVLVDERKDKPEPEPQPERDPVAPLATR